MGNHQSKKQRAAEFNKKREADKKARETQRAIVVVTGASKAHMRMTAAILGGVTLVKPTSEGDV